MKRSRATTQYSLINNVHSCSIYCNIDNKHCNAFLCWDSPLETSKHPPLRSVLALSDIGVVGDRRCVGDVRTIDVSDRRQRGRKLCQETICIYSMGTSIRESKTLPASSSIARNTLGMDRLSLCKISPRIRDIHSTVLDYSSAWPDESEYPRSLSRHPSAAIDPQDHSMRLFGLVVVYSSRT